MVAGFKASPPRVGQDDAWSRAQFLALETRLGLLEAFLENTVAYGGMRITAPRTGSNIGVAWQPIAPYDAETVEAIGCEFDLPSGAFTVKRPGVWRISLFVEATVNNSGSVRELDFRLRNALTGLQIGSSWLVECQNRVVSLSFTGVYDLSALENVPIIVDVSSPSAFSSVVWLQQNIGLDYAGALPSRSYAAGVAVRAARGRSHDDARGHDPGLGLDARGGP